MASGTKNPHPVNQMLTRGEEKKTCARPVQGRLGRKLAKTPQTRQRTLARVATHSAHAYTVTRSNDKVKGTLGSQWCRRGHHPVLQLTAASGYWAAPSAFGSWHLGRQGGCRGPGPPSPEQPSHSQSPSGSVAVVRPTQRRW